MIPVMDIYSYINKKRELFDQIIKYYYVSIISCTVNLGTRYIFNFIFSFVASVFLSSILGGLIQFILAKNYVFHSNEKVTKEIVLYGIIATFGIFLITALSAGFEIIFVTYHIQILSKNMTYLIIQLLSLGINSIVGFFLCRYIVFTGPSCKHKTD
jgi:putative flippase GtrA